MTTPMISKRKFTRLLAGGFASAASLAAPRALWAQARGSAIELAGYTGADRQQRLHRNATE